MTKPRVGDRHYTVAFVFILFMLAGGIASAYAEDVTWIGCGITKNAFMAEVAAAYEAKTGIKTTLSGGGATKGIRTVSAGTSDMGGTCRHRLVNDTGEINPAETDAVLTQVAWDAVVVITHADNPVDNISLEHLKGIYDGRITSWKDLGGPDHRIILVTRGGKTSGVGYMFRLLAFNDPDYEFKARSFEVKSTGPLEKKVEATPAALALDGVSSARKLAVKILSIDGVAPTKENIAAGRYPMFRPLYLVTSAKASPETTNLLAFTLSPEGQAIVSQEGTVNLEEGKALESLWSERKKSFKR